MHPLKQCARTPSTEKIAAQAEPPLDLRILEIIKKYLPSKDVVTASKWMDNGVYLEQILNLEVVSRNVLKIYLLAAANHLITDGYDRSWGVEDLYAKYQSHGLLENQEQSFSHYYNDPHWLRTTILKSSIDQRDFQRVVLEILNHFKELKYSKQQLYRLCINVFRYTKDPLLAATALRVLHDENLSLQINPKELRDLILLSDKVSMLKANIGLGPFLNSHELPMGEFGKGYSELLLIMVSDQGYMELIEALPILPIPSQSIMILFENRAVRPLSKEHISLWSKRVSQETRISQEQKIALNKLRENVITPGSKNHFPYLYKGPYSALLHYCSWRNDHFLQLRWSEAESAVRKLFKVAPNRVSRT